jgi:hypothetical protein
METFIQTELATKIIGYLQYRIAQKLSAGQNILTLLLSLEVVDCLFLLEQIDPSINYKYLYH